MRRRHPDESAEKKGKAVVTRRTPHLLDEIVEEILLTHPASSLFQLRSVCRSWRTLISCSRFTNEHLRRSIFLDPTLTRPRIAYYSFPSKYPTIGVFSVRSLLDNNKPTKVASFKAPRYFTIFGSCNGLLCLAHETDTGVMTCILWNPCTGSTSEPAPQITGGFGFYGFGYDHISDRYKLIGYLQSEEESRSCSSRIYTFAPNSSWRTIPIEDDVDFTLLGHPPDECPIYDCNNMEGVFVSNTLNWIVDRYRSSDVVLSFDLGKETYCYLPLPERDPEDDLCLSVVSVLRNCLAVCFEHKRTHWAVWLMKEFGVTQSWTRLALIPHQVGYNPNDSYNLRPQYLMENDVLLAISPFGKIVLYNLNNNNNKDGPLVPMIDGTGDGMERGVSVDAFSRGFIVYHESLVSPSHYGIASKRPLIKPNKPTTVS